MEEAIANTERLQYGRVDDVDPIVRVPEFIREQVLALLWHLILDNGDELEEALPQDSAASYMSKETIERLIVKNIDQAVARITIVAWLRQLQARKGASP